MLSDFWKWQFKSQWFKSFVDFQHCYRKEIIYDINMLESMLNFGKQY